MRRSDLKWLVPAILCGGILGPVLLLMGIEQMPAHQAGLLSNTETFFTVILAVLFFGDRLRRRDALAIVALIAGAAMVAGLTPATPMGIVFILAGALMWAVDNNVTQRLSKRDPLSIAAIKGLVAGPVNLLIAAAMDISLPRGAATLGLAAVIGLLTVGFSLVLFIYGLRHLGASRVSGLFATAPAFTVLISWLFLNESPTAWVIGGGALMFAGTILILRSAPALKKEPKRDTLESSS